MPGTWETTKAAHLRRGLRSGPDAPFTDRFTIRRQLGAGGMGVVYEAYDHLARDTVALKTLVHANAAGFYRLKNEFRSLADFAHPNLVAFYEFFMESGLCFFTMELVHGVNFLHYCTGIERFNDSGSDSGFTTSSLSCATTFRHMGATPRTETPPAICSGLPMRRMPAQVDRLRPALRQVAEGLCVLHEGGKLHRDIKPSNILVTASGRVVVLDFGLITEEINITEHSELVGTPAYMSPEQAAGRPLAPASDWYSFGVMLYEALTGRLPIDGTFREVLTKKQSVDPIAPSDLAEAVPGDLEELCLDLLQREPAARPGGAEVLRRLQSRKQSPGGFSVRRAARSFVGRDEQMAALWEAFSRSREGATVKAYIHGNSGMGKSTLARNFLTQLEERGSVLILRGRCYERESIPYKALDGVVDSLSRYITLLPAARVEALLPRGVDALAKMFPVLQRVPAIARYPAPGSISDPLTRRRRAFAALRDLLGRISDGIPLVIFIDDLHWSDMDSMALLEDLLRPPDGPPLLLLATFRSEAIAASPFLKGLLDEASSSDCLELRLEGLSSREARSLATVLSGDAAANEPFIDTVIREAHGNPFLIEQMVRWSADVGDTRARHISVSEILAARLQQLPKGARTLLRIMAVAGHPVPVQILLRTSSLGQDAAPLIAELRSACFIRTAGRAQMVDLYHDQIRETIAVLLQPDELRHIHRLLAESLIAAGVDDPEVLFEHWIGAGQSEPALKYAMLAGAKAAAALAFDRAAAFYRRALEVMPAQSPQTEELQGELAGALANAGRPAEAASVYLDVAKRLQDGRALELQRRAAEQYLLGGHIDEGMDVCRRVLDQVGLKPAPGPRMALLSLLWRRLQLRWRGLRFVERSASTIAPATLLRIDLCWSVAAGLAMVDNIRGADFQTRHLLLALRAGEPYRVARAFAVEAGFSATTGASGRRRAERFSRMAAALSERVQHPHAIGLTKLTAGVGAFLLGEWKRAVELCSTAEEILRDQCTGVHWELASARNFMLDSLLYRGDLAEIRRRVPEMVVNWEERGNLYGVTLLKTRMNFMRLADDDPAHALSELTETMRTWSHQGFHLQHYNAMRSRLQIALYTGNANQAWQIVTSQWRHLRNTMLWRIQVLRLEALLLRGRSALAMAACHNGRGGAFLVEAERLARAVEREHMAWANPLARLLCAGVEWLRGHSSLAMDLLAEAGAGFERADMALHAAVVRKRLGELLDSPQSRSLSDDADTWMQSQGIRNPAAIVNLLAPGFHSRNFQRSSR